MYVQRLTLALIQFILERRYVFSSDPEPNDTLAKEGDIPGVTDQLGVSETSRPRAAAQEDWSPR
jgi:hypothetical protein